MEMNYHLRIIFYHFIIVPKIKSVLIRFFSNEFLK